MANKRKLIITNSLDNELELNVNSCKELEFIINGEVFYVITNSSDAIELSKEIINFVESDKIMHF